MTIGTFTWHVLLRALLVATLVFCIWGCNSYALHQMKALEDTFKDRAEPTKRAMGGAAPRP